MIQKNGISIIFQVNSLIFTVNLPDPPGKGGLESLLKVSPTGEIQRGLLAQQVSERTRECFHPLD
jgi:hypothetical protein